VWVAWFVSGGGVLLWFWLFVLDGGFLYTLFLHVHPPISYMYILRKKTGSTRHMSTLRRISNINLSGQYN